MAKKKLTAAERLVDEQMLGILECLGSSRQVA
jgi:hypothetical protein